jgi:hypothetical protein
MHKFIFYISLFFILASTETAFAQCRSLKVLKEEFQKAVKPYDFEGISAGVLPAGKTKNISISVFSKVKYRLNFRTDEFDAPVVIKVLAINRQVLWSNEKDPENMMFEFIPFKTEKYFVEFTAPASQNDDSRGCIAVVLSSRPY